MDFLAINFSPRELLSMLDIFWQFLSEKSLLITINFRESKSSPKEMWIMMKFCGN
jgi:hypothetical protein